MYRIDPMVSIELQINASNLMNSCPSNLADCSGI